MIVSSLVGRLVTGAPSTRRPRRARRASASQPPLQYVVTAVMTPSITSHTCTRRATRSPSGSCWVSTCSVRNPVEVADGPHDFDLCRPGRDRPQLRRERFARTLELESPHRRKQVEEGVRCEQVVTRFVLREASVELLAETLGRRLVERAVRRLVRRHGDRSSVIVGVDANVRTLRTPPHRPAEPIRARSTMGRMHHCRHRRRRRTALRAGRARTHGRRRRPGRSRRAWRTRSRGGVARCAG